MKPRLTPFLTLPLPEGTDFRISEGWFYSLEERKIHGHLYHKGIDFDVSRSTPVLAAADGWAMASYHLAYSGEYQGKRVGFGLGWFVQLWHEEAKVFTCYAHLEQINEARAPFTPPKSKDDTWYPPALNQPVEEQKSVMTQVRRGEVIGFVGDSGCTWGYEEYPDGRPAPEVYPSWDETHLHFELYTRDTQKHLKEHRWDPFGIYAGAADYRDLKQTAAGLWLTDTAGKPCYATPIP